jgi:hypothetical protein
MLFVSELEGGRKEKKMENEARCCGDLEGNNEQRAAVEKG